MSNTQLKGPRQITATEENPLNVIKGDQVVVATYSPDHSGRSRPTEVHAYIHVQGLDDTVALIFKTPQQLARVITELSKAGQRTWDIRKKRRPVAGIKGMRPA